VGALTGIKSDVFWRNKKVLITGHTGFKGSWLSYWLTTSGASLCGLSLNPITVPSLWNELEVDLGEFDIRADIRSQDWVQKVSDFAPEIVFHLAAQPLVVTGWQDPLLTFDTNVIGTGNLLKELNAMPTVKTILVVTTDKVYKLDEQIITRKETDELGGKDPYAASKAAVELLVAAWPIREDIRIATARSGNVIGGGDWSEDRLIPDIIRAGVSGTSLEIRNPKAIRPWQHVVEPLYGYLSMAKSMAEGSLTVSAMNFGPAPENQITVEEIIEYCLKVLPQEYSFSTLFTPEKYKESEFLLLDSLAAKTRLDWKPLLSWKEAIELSLDWYIKFNAGNNPRLLIECDIVHYLNKLGK